jgi:hypothetical protein
MIISFFTNKLRTHPMGLEPTTLPSTLLLQGEEVPLKLVLIGKINQNQNIKQIPNANNFQPIEN